MQSPPLSSQGPPNKSAREGRQNKMPTANERELARLSLESGVAVKDIEAKLKELLKGGLDDEGAMAVWKSDNSSKLGGRIVKDALLRVVSSEKPRTVENDDGSTTKVGSFSAFVVDGEKIAFAGFSLWREKADLTASIVPGQLYKADVKLRDNPKDGGNRGTLLTDLNEASEEEGKVIPTAEALIKKCEVKSLGEIADLVGTNAFFKGIVGKVIQKKDGGEAYGVEVSEPGSNPVAVFINDFNPSTVKPGQRVMFYGYVGSGKKGISIRSSGLFLA